MARGGSYLFDPVEYAMERPSWGVIDNPGMKAAFVRERRAKNARKQRRAQKFMANAASKFGSPQGSDPDSIRAAVIRRSKSTTAKKRSIAAKRRSESEWKPPAERMKDFAKKKQAYNDAWKAEKARRVKAVREAGSGSRVAQQVQPSSTKAQKARVDLWKADKAKRTQSVTAAKGGPMKSATSSEAMLRGKSDVARKPGGLAGAMAIAGKAQPPAAARAAAQKAAAKRAAAAKKLAAAKKAAAAARK